MWCAGGGGLVVWCGLAVAVFVVCGVVRCGVVVHILSDLGAGVRRGVVSCGARRCGGGFGGVVRRGGGDGGGCAA